MAGNNPFHNLLTEVKVGQSSLRYYSLEKLKDPRVAKLPYSIRILLESAVRNCDNFEIKKEDVENILNWEHTVGKIEIPFKPARVLLQDFTGVPAVVDLAAMRDAMKRLGGDPSKINPLVPADLVIDHSIQVDFSRSNDALEKNQELEFERNKERFQFLKWGASAFKNFLIVPPGSGIVHQVNLEYLARCVFNTEGLLYPDSVVGTDSHTTMINGLGVCGWGVGGIEAEAVMLGQAISMLLPEVVGYKLVGDLPPTTTSTDLVLTITENLRKLGVVGKFVEFYGEGVKHLSIADRSTLSNMAPEYGATIGFFPVDHVTVEFLHQTGRDAHKVEYIEQYLRAEKMFRTYESKEVEPLYSTYLTLDLSTVVPSLSGPKRPHDRVSLSNMKQDFSICLKNKVGFKGYGLAEEKLGAHSSFEFDRKQYTISHGAVVIAAITSCTNTSNPSVMLGAGLLARKARAAGLEVPPYIKTSLSPGSGVVSEYLSQSGLLEDLKALGFHVAGFGCMTCIGNSGDLHPAVAEAIQKQDLVAAAVLSGNRNFEGRVHPLTRANYLASPPLVVAYALAGSVHFDFEIQPLGTNAAGKQIFLKDIWPTRQEVEEFVKKFITPAMFHEVYSKISKGTDRWNSLQVESGLHYNWSDSTYIHDPPFFKTMVLKPAPVSSIKDAYCLLNLGDSITTDHISPAGNISKTSPAALYLTGKGVKVADFNTYGARRGNDEVMARGTFANIRLVNKLVKDAGPKTIDVRSGEELPIFDASARYIKDGHPLIILAGGDYGSGSSRDWAAKGPALLGVKAVIAVSFERIHRSNLVGMGIVPLQFKAGENADSLGLTGKEQFSIDLPTDLKPGQTLTVHTNAAKQFEVICRFDTEVELEYFRHGGILAFVLRKLLGHK